MRILPKQPGFHEMSSVVFFRILFRKSFQHFLRHRRRCNGLLRLSATRRHCVVAFHVMLSDLWASLEAQLLAAPILAMHTRQITRSPYCHSQPQSHQIFHFRRLQHLILWLGYHCSLHRCQDVLFWSSQNLLFGGK